MLKLTGIPGRVDVYERKNEFREFQFPCKLPFRLIRLQRFLKNLLARTERRAFCVPFLLTRKLESSRGAEASVAI